jgi:hypothetical protein
MTWRELKGQAFPLVIDDEMQFEAIEPAPGRLAPRGPACEYLVGGNAAVMTDGQRRRVDERNTHATAFAGVQITTQGDEGLGHQLDKAGVTHQWRNIWSQIGHHMLRIVVFERPVMTAMKVDEHGHDLTQGQRCLSLAGALAGLEQVPRIHRDKRLAEIVDIAEHRNELQFAHRDPLMEMIITFA